MGKKKAFVNKKNAEKFRLIPESSSGGGPEPTERFAPSKEHLENQHKFGIFFDDDYDYTQHLRDRNEKTVMLSLDETRTVVPAAPSAPSLPAFMLDSSSYAKKRVVFDDDIDRALEGEIEDENGCLDDNFVAMAGGALDESILRPRNVNTDDDSDEDGSFNDCDDYGMDEEDMEEEEKNVDAPAHPEGERDVDAAFEKMLEADYGDEQMGELDGEAGDIAGGIEPDDLRMKRLVGEKRALPLYDEQLAKEYVKARMAVLAEKGSEDEEEIEVEMDESARKRMKWDCESFATQYTNIYNRPSIIKEGGISRRALKKLEKKAIEEEESVEEDSEDDEYAPSLASTTTSFRPRGETTEERKARKAVVKEQRRSRRVEKKQNQLAFAAEQRQALSSRAGRIRATPIQ